MCGVLLLHKIHLDFCGLIIPYHPKCINLALFACCLFEGKLELAGGVNGARETGKRGQRNGQAGHRGTHDAKLDLPPTARGPICLLVAAPPNPFEQPGGAGCAFLRNAFLTGLRPSGTVEKSAFLFPAVRFLFLLLGLIAHELLHVGPDGQQLLHILPRLAEIGISRLFLRQKRGIFSL